MIIIKIKKNIFFYKMSAAATDDIYVVKDRYGREKTITKDEFQKFIETGDGFPKIEQRQLTTYLPPLPVLTLSNYTIPSLNDITFERTPISNPPNNYQGLEILNSSLKTLGNVRFHPKTIYIALSSNKIKSLDGVHFPVNAFGKYLSNYKQGLAYNYEIILNNNEIDSLHGAVFPEGLTHLNLANNQIRSLEGATFPMTLMKIDLTGNPLETLNGVPQVILHQVKKQFPHLAQQTKELKLSIEDEVLQLRNHVETLVGFLRPQIEAQNEQNMQAISQGASVFYVRLNGKNFPVQYNGSMLIQDVIDYLKTQYFVSLLNNCDDMKLILNSSQLTPDRNVADSGIQSGSVVHAVCRITSEFPMMVTHVRKSQRAGKKRRTRTTKHKRQK